MIDLQSILAIETRLEAAICASENVTPQTIADLSFNEALNAPTAEIAGAIAARAVLLPNLTDRRDIASRWLLRFRRENSAALLEIVDVALAAATEARDALRQHQEALCLSAEMTWTPSPSYLALDARCGEIGLIRHQISTGEAGAAAILRLQALPPVQIAKPAAVTAADEVIERRNRRTA